jgi:molybdate transport system substrate-binding protein
MSQNLQTEFSSITRIIIHCRAFLAACLIALLFATAHAQTTLRIAAASDLAPALPPILADFEKQSGIKTQTTYQASATLTTQIRNGAPFDLFLSADLTYPQSLIDSHIAPGPKPILYARGNLVLWCPKDSPLAPPTLAQLSNASLKRLAIANPERAPYGRAAVAVLNQLHLYDALKPKLVIAENISQTAQFVESGNADAGFISLTAALTPQLKQHGAYFTIPNELYPPIEQGAVILNSSTQSNAAQQLLNYLLSEPIQQRLEAAGLSRAIASSHGNKAK